MKTDWRNLAAQLICAATGLAAAYFAVKYLLCALLPFLIAWGVALAVSPAASWLSGRTHTPRWLWVVMILVLGLGTLAGILWLAVDRLVLETGALLSRLGEIRASDISGMIDRVISRLPLLDELAGAGADERAQIVGVLMDALSGVLTWLGGTLSSFALRTVTGLPSGLLALTVTVVACFYFSLQLDAIHAALSALLPERARAAMSGGDGAQPMRRRVTRGLWRWLQAYGILFFMTFGELLAGFLMLGVDYALLVALLVAVIDLLPVLGTGTVLVPWALWCLVTGQVGRGIGLLVLYGVITVVRQVAEPHVVGSSFGMHPLLSLMAMYVGFRLLGVVGMILFPAILVLIGIWRPWETEKEPTVK